MADSKKDFLRKTIEKDLNEAAISSFTGNVEAKKVFEEEINPEQKAQKLKLKKKARRKLIISIISIIIIIMIVSSVFVYFFYISPVFIRKPYIEKPVLSEEDPMITSEHITYIVNELGGYKLHGGPLGKAAQMELFLSDINKRFTITVEDHNIFTVGGNAPNPDIRLNAPEEVFIDLIRAEDLMAKAKELVGLEIVSIDPLLDETVLAMKGYKAIYDTLSGKIIGTSSFFKLTPAVKKLIYLISVIIVAILGIIYITRK
ncbi:hypothetical protein GF371_00215 [Candidatus Woesearchaeota archaeon]|nr:hypothetical protein [Candidatus Woesearchaeota archaeon]